MPTALWPKSSTHAFWRQRTPSAKNWIRPSLVIVSRLEKKRTRMWGGGVKRSQAHRLCCGSCWRRAGRLRPCMQITLDSQEGSLSTGTGDSWEPGACPPSLTHTHRKQRTPWFPSIHPSLFSSLCWLSLILPLFSVCLGFCLVSVAMFALSRLSPCVLCSLSLRLSLCTATRDN